MYHLIWRHVLGVYGTPPSSFDRSSIDPSFLVDQSYHVVRCVFEYSAMCYSDSEARDVEHSMLIVDNVLFHVYKLPLKLISSIDQCSR